MKKGWSKRSKGFNIYLGREEFADVFVDDQGRIYTSVATPDGVVVENGIAKTRMKYVLVDGLW